MKMKPSTKSKVGASGKKLCTYKVLKNLTADGIKEFATYILEEAIYHTEADTQERVRTVFRKF